MLEYLQENDPESAKAIEIFFEAFGWPVPESQSDRNKRAYYVAAGGRLLVFLTDYGLVLRITPERAVFKAQNPHFLMPLFNRAAGRYRIDLDPGYDCPVPEAQYRPIYQVLREKYGVIVEDMKPQNLAYIPGTDYPVAIDLDPLHLRVNPRLIVADDSASRLFADVAAVRAILETDGSGGNPQAEIYAPLRKALEEAWPENEKAPNPVGIAAFKALCREFKNNGTLLAPWANKKNDYWGTTQAALNYAQALRRVDVGPV